MMIHMTERDLKWMAVINWSLLALQVICCVGCLLTGMYGYAAANAVGATFFAILISKFRKKK